MESLRDLIESRTTTREDRHRLVVFLIVETMLILGLPLHLAGLLGSDNMVLQLDSVIHWLLSVGLLLLYYYQRISLQRSLHAYAIMAMVAYGTKIVYLSVVQPEDANYYIIVNEFLTFMIVFVLIMGYVERWPFLVTVVNGVFCMVALVATGDRVHLQFLVFFFFIGTFTSLMGSLLRRSIETVEAENSLFRERQKQLLRAMNISEQEFLAYFELATDSNPYPQGVDALFDRIGVRMERNIVHAVKVREKRAQVERQRIRDIFPMLTRSEVEVCQLILLDKSLREIARLTGKSENNVSTVRTHIRRKLGLTPTDNLLQRLKKEVAAHKPSTQIALGEAGQ